MSSPVVTVMITTRNRVEELELTLASCLAQVGPALEILVVDDASTDATSEIVRARFPQVNLVRNERNRGSIASRNDILRRASGRYVIALDDDSRFVDNDACQRIVERMDAEPDIGILSFQPIGPEHPERMQPAGRLQGEWHCSSFAACAAAIRRSMLDRVGLFPEFFFHAYEEVDLCIRAWSAGYRVLQWNDIIVYHAYSGIDRNEQRTHRRHARNEACSVIMRYPWYLVPPAVLWKLSAQFRYAWRRGWTWREPRVWLEVCGRLPQALWHRRPVCAAAVKICVAVNRVELRDADAVWQLGQVSWRNVLGGNLQAAGEVPGTGASMAPSCCDAAAKASREAISAPAVKQGRPG
jgi:GT2 family glycosyltransferase